VNYGTSPVDGLYKVDWFFLAGKDKGHWHCIKPNIQSLPHDLTPEHYFINKI
jgi:hypothetical protein